MGQKANPISLRLAKTTRYFDAGWYSDSFYDQVLTRELGFQRYLDLFFKNLKLPTARLSVWYTPKKTQLYTFFCHPKQVRALRAPMLGLPDPTVAPRSPRRGSQLVESPELLDSSRQGTSQALAVLGRSQVLQYLEHQVLRLKHPGGVARALPEIQNTTIRDPKGVSGRGHFFLNLASRLCTPVLGSTTLLAGQKNQTSALTKSSAKRRDSIPFSVKLENTSTDYEVRQSSKSLLSPFSETQSLGVTPYRAYIQNHLAKASGMALDFMPLKVLEDWQSAGYIADELAYYIEKRVPFRVLKTRLVKTLLQHSAIRGIRITSSGRVGGKSKKAQRAKTECIKVGQTCLHVFSSRIDFAARTAQTNFGSVGLKVWVCFTEPRF